MSELPFTAALVALLLLLELSGGVIFPEIPLQFSVLYFSQQLPSETLSLQLPH